MKGINALINRFCQENMRCTVRSEISGLRQRRPRYGFTLVELAFSLSFITVLFLTLLALIIYITGIYQKGLVIRSVNANGRELTDDFTRSINAAPAKSADLVCQYKFSPNSSGYSACTSDHAHKFYSNVTTGNVSINGTQKTVPIYGAICTGRYSYVWNSGYALSGNNAAKAELSVVGGGHSGTTDNFHLLKIRDDTLAVCGSKIPDGYSGVATGGNTYSIELPDDANDERGYAYELLPRSEDNLAIYDLNLFTPVQHVNTGRTFESVTFILGTVAGGIDITATGDFCTDIPDNLNTDYNYCAINKFNFATYSTGELTGAEKNDENHKINLYQITGR